MHALLLLVPRHDPDKVRSLGGGAEVSLPLQSHSSGAMHIERASVHASSWDMQCQCLIQSCMLVGTPSMCRGHTLCL